LYAYISLFPLQDITAMTGDTVDIDVAMDDAIASTKYASGDFDHADEDTSVVNEVSPFALPSKILNQFV
jgi:hypothetical protein